MRILIATGIYPPDIGGPAQYALGVEEVWQKAGHEVKVLSFRFERRLPTGIRHVYYFLRVLFSLPGVDFVFSPDTFSAALPALLASTLLGKQLIIRTGGDFLWEWYVERTGDLVLLRDFYSTRLLRLNRKERIIFSLLRFLFRHADAIIFSTAWQRDIFTKPYGLNAARCHIVENYYGSGETTPSAKTRPSPFIKGETSLLRRRSAPSLRLFHFEKGETSLLRRDVGVLPVYDYSTLKRENKIFV